MATAEVTTDQFHDEIVMVPVPRSALPAVYATLSRSMNSPGSSDAGPIGDGTAVSVKGTRSEGRWTEMKLQRVEGILSPRKFPATRALFTMAAERAPRTVTFGEAADRAGVEVKRFRGELGALTKVIKRLFDGETSWPVSVHYGDQGEASYSMDPQISEWWLRACGDGDGLP
jgi:hypothetical protein